MDQQSQAGRRARSTRRSASAAATAPARARRRGADTRARSRVRATSSSAGSKAARCRCTGASRSAGFHNPFRTEYAVVNLDTLAERFDAGTVVTPELLRERGRDSRRQPADQGAGARRHLEEADGARAQVQRQGGGEDRRRRRRGGDDWRAKPRGEIRGEARRTGCRMGKRWITTRSRICSQVADLRNRVLFTLGDAGRVSHRQPHPDAGREHRRAAAAGRRAEEHDVRPLRHVLRREPVEGDDLRAGHHALHQLVDHPAAADGGLAVPRADVEGRRARPPQDHAVHALPDAACSRSCRR